MSCLQSLLEDIENLLLDPESSDIVLLCQGVEIKAHRTILSARSPVFRAMLRSDMSETNGGIIKMEDVDTEVLKEMLTYMYTAKIDDKFTKIQELLVLANKYEVVELMNYCGTKLVKSLNNENALEIGIFAEFHNAEDLLKECVHYICKHPDSLNENWREKIEGSTKIMLDIIQISLKEKVEVQEIMRNGVFGSYGHSFGSR